VTGVEAIAVKIGERAVKYIGGRLRQRMRPDTSRAALIKEADQLADAVDSRETALLAQLRGGRNMIVDDLEFRAELRLRLAAGDAAGVLKDIGPYFRRQQTRRLVVLGEPGAGKTVAVVHLLLDQLQYRKTLPGVVRADEPVPVRVNAAGWDGSRDFAAWLAHQLSIDYGLNPQVARAMVKADRILPVLDGLDEMDPPAAAPVLASSTLERLNKSPRLDSAVVVACRSNVYEAIREFRPDAGLQFATTVTLQPLSAEDIYFYLEQYRDELGRAEVEWTPVTDQLDQADGVLATALRTPWLLSLAATALKRGGHETAVELAACRDTDKIRERLFASLIPAAVDAIPESDSAPNYTEEDVQRWLRVLAQYLQQRRRKHSGGTQIALDEIWQLAGTRTCRALHAVIGAVVIALGTGLAVTSGTLTWWLADSVRIIARLDRQKVLAIPWYSLDWDWRGYWHGQFPFDLVRGLAVGLLFGLVFFLGSAFDLPGAYAWAAARYAARGRPPPAGARLARNRRTAERFARRGRGVSKRSAWRVPGRSRWRRGLVRGLVVGIFTGLLLTRWVASGYAHDGVQFEGGAFVIAFVLALGLGFGLMSGLGTTSEERLSLGQDAGRLIHDDLVNWMMVALVWLGVCLTIGPLLGVARWLQIAGQPWESSYRAPDGSYKLTHLPALSPGAALQEWPASVLPGVALGLSVGLVLAIFVASLAAGASGRYAIASLLFGFTRVFPRRPARFLEWARKAGLLRVTGVAYQFRHDTYGEWLTDGTGNRDVTRRSRSPANARSG
jgi:hypothetical protein